MTIDPQNRRLRTIALGAAVLGGAAAAAAVANPAAAQGMITAVTTVSCSVTGANWCISGNNSSSGIGVIGTSKTGTGLRGTSTSQYGLKATSVTGTAILAQSTSGSAGVYASAPNGYGLEASGGIGVSAVSTSSSYGVYGSTTSGAGDAVVGVVSSGVGVYGVSSSGRGVQAYATVGTGVYATNSSGNANPAIYGQNSNGNAGDFRGSYIGTVSRTPAGGFPIVATDPAGNNLFYVDGSGNVSYRGGLFHFAAVGGGAVVKSFSPNSTQPTVEDIGTAQLVAGAAAVRLDPTFAASIDPNTTYRVFLTPNGDTRGLFVAAKIAGGFIVRESQAGRSTVTFDYRIVATALGQNGQRMAVVNAAAAGLGPRATPAVMSASPPAPLQAPVALPATP